ncbi:MAG: hypothetical protein J6036_03785 [Clostridia bacterium]|nr:hypothetical protein [Clostridia bacterium]
MKINLIAENKEQELVLAYLTEHAGDDLAEKINEGTPFEKDGKMLTNKKTLDGFMKYASDEARKLAEKGKQYACVQDEIVYGWAMHYFEEDGIEGTLYNPDGTEYKPAVKAVPSQKPPISHVKPQNTNLQFSFFDAPQEDDEPSKKDIQDAAEEPVNEEQPVPEKPKGNAIYQNYMNIQARFPDCVVAYHLGDFYEIFGQNAVNVAKELDLTLTGRDCGLETRVPMVGFPYHVADNYISQLVSKGFKVAVAVTMDEIVLRQNDMRVNAETGEILDDETTEKELMKNYRKDALLCLLDLFGSDATIG